jgi:hypothetical protein
VASPKKSDGVQIRIPETPASGHIDGERKTVTAVFADIKGSMELIEDLDPEAARNDRSGAEADDRRSAPL